MGRNERSTIIGEVGQRRMRKVDKKDRVEQADPAIRSTRDIIDGLIKGRELYPGKINPQLSLTINPETNDSIEVVIEKINRGGGSASVYEITVQDFDRIATLYTSYGFIRKSGVNEAGTHKKSKNITSQTAQRYLEFFRTVQAGVTLGGVVINNPLARTPQASR